MMPKLKLSDIHLTLSLAENLPRAAINSIEFEYVLTNLIANAVQSMPGGGSLYIKTNRLRNLKTIEIEIKDSGGGIPKENMSRIFEPFFTTKEKGKGTGLGLATVYSVIQQAGGFVHVESKLGQGTLFKIFLPTMKTKWPERKAAKVECFSTRGSEVVLLVEDDVSVRTILKKGLSQQGYRVFDVVNGVEALDWARANGGPVDVLVTDLLMPQMNGRELADRLSSLRPDLRVLFMSGYPQETLAPNGILEPDTYLLQKPFSAEDLARKVRELLDTPRPGDLVSNELARP